MEPRIQYAKTSDGVRIAFTVVGQGPPLVICGDISDAHAQLVWEQSHAAPFYKQLATRHAVVKYDPRGFGLSDRNVTDFSLDARLADVAAVVEQLQMPEFFLLGFNTGGTIAMAYAANHREQVKRLALVSARAREAESRALHRAGGAVSLIRTDWEMFLEVLAAANTGFGKEESSHVAKFLGAAMEPIPFARWAAASGADDVSDSLPDIACPTLIVHYSRVHYVAMEMARELASEIRDSRLVVLDYEWILQGGEAGTAVLEFLAEEAGEEQTDRARALVTPFRTVLFTDLVGHTEMMSRLGDVRGRDVLREHERITREVLKVHGGTEVKTMGDGFMASFGSVTKAVECAVALQRAFEERNSDVGARHASPLRVRCGLNAGEPIEEDGDLFGATVILASRIAARAEGGEILVADTVRGLCSGKGFSFADRGEFNAKGFEEPVRVSEVRWRD